MNDGRLGINQENINTPKVLTDEPIKLMQNVRSKMPSAKTIENSQEIKTWDLMKIVLVGKKSTGKTTLKNRLVSPFRKTNDTPKKDEDHSTQGSFLILI